MSELAGFPYIEINFDKKGKVVSATSPDAVETFVRESGLTDLCVVSHGWNNDRSEAFQLYSELFKSVRAQLTLGTVDLTGRKIGVLGIIWPSKKFKGMAEGAGTNAAGFGSAESDETVNALLDDLKGVLDEDDVQQSVEDLKRLVPELDNDPAARQSFANGLRAMLPQDAASADDASTTFFAADAEALFHDLDAPFLMVDAPGGGQGAAGGLGDLDGGAAGIGDFFCGAKAAARRLLNYATYYVMKARAGTVGEKGVSKLMQAIRQVKSDTKLHLIGHSFGGRLLSAAAQRAGDTAGAEATSAILLQAAFSHNGFAKAFKPGADGYFRSVMASKKVHGPVLITYTHNDKANAIAYPIASRIAGQNAAAFGGPGDIYGAIGANGAQHTPEAIKGTLLDAGAPGYAFASGKVYNLRADKHIADHGDVRGEAVAYAILSAVAAT